MNLKYKISIILIFVATLLCTDAVSQNGQGEAEQKKEAESFFTTGDYTKALPYYSQLLSLYPKDPLYNYRYAVCLVETNQQIDKAISYLEYASTKDVDNKIFYYLGMANHLSYKFEIAVDYYTRFKQYAKKPDLDLLQVDWKITMCQNGIDLIKYISDLIVLENKRIDYSNFFYSYELADFGGNIIVKPSEYKSKLDKKSGERDLMFLSDKHGVIYYGSYGTDKKMGKDIYRISRIEDGNWSEPENLGPIINTPYDEDFPFIHPDGLTLYFCSKGHNSMGGYDIFKSVFDMEKGDWSEPVNMDFPTNSPYDDILYISDASEDFAYFASNRETYGDEISVYKIQVDKNPVEKKIDNLDEILQKSKLEVTPVASNSGSEMHSSSNAGLSDQSLRDGAFSFIEVELGATPADEMLNILAKDAEEIQKKAQDNKTDAAISYMIAYEESNKADAKQKEAEDLYSIASQATNPEDKKLRTAEADMVQSEANDLKRKAVTAYSIAKNLENIAIQRQKQAEETSNMAGSLTEANPDEIYKSLSTNRQSFLDNQKNYPTIDNEIERRQTLKNERQEELGKVNTVISSLDTDLNSLKENIRTSKRQLDADPGNTTIKRNLDDFLAQYKEVEKEKAKQIAKQKSLQLEFTNINEEIYFLEDLTARITRNSESKAEIAEKITKIDKSGLEKEIENKELAIDESMAIEVAETKAEVISESNEFLEEVGLTPEGELAATTTNTPPLSDNGSNVSETNEASETEIALPDNSDLVEYTSASAIPAKTFSNEDSKSLYSEARNNEEVAMNLIKEADIRRKEVVSLTNPEEKSILLKEIKEMEDNARYKIEQAKVKYNEAQKNEEEFLAANNIETTETNENSENIEATENLSLTTDANNTSENNTNTNPVNNESGTNPTDGSEVLDAAYTFGESTTVTKFEKSLFNGQFFENLAEEAENKLSVMEVSVDTISDPKTKEAVIQQIKALKEEVSINKEKAANSYREAEKMRNEAGDEIEYETISADELALKASMYDAKMDIPFSPAEKTEYEKINFDRIKANDQLFVFDGYSDKLEMFYMASETTTDKEQREEIDKQLAEIEAEAKEAFIVYDTSIASVNKKEFELIESLVNQNRLIADNEKIKLANNLEKEASIYFAKAQFSRDNAKLMERFQDQYIQLLKVKNLELSAIEKQKHALDLYLQAKEEGIGEPDLTAGAFNNEETKELTLLSEEEAQIERFREKLDYATTLERESDRILAEIEKKKKEADQYFSEKEKDKILKGIEEEEAVAKQKLVIAYAAHHVADSLKYNLYKNQISQLTETLEEVGDNKRLAAQYINEADFYFSEAKKIILNTATITDLSEKVKELNRAKNFEKKALTSQEIALDVLIEPDPVTFVSSNELVKVDRLEALNQPVDVRMIIKVQEDKIIDKLKLDEFDLKALDESRQLANDGEQFMGTAAAVEEDIKALNEVVNSSASKSEKKNAAKRLKKLDKELKDYKFAAMENYENANDYKYWVYKENFVKVRIKGTSDKARMGRQLEKNADTDYNNAKKLRDKAITLEKDADAFAMMEKAKKLEERALENQHKAYGIYLGLPTIQEDSLLLANKNMNGVGIPDEEIIRTQPDITPLTDSTETSLTVYTNTSGNNDLAENNTDTGDNNNTEIETNSEAVTNTEVETNNGTETNNDLAENSENTTETTETDNTVVENDSNNGNDNGANTNTALSYSTEFTDEAAKEIAEMLAARGYGWAFDPNAKYGRNNPIPKNTPCPTQNIYYKIQVGAFKDEVNESIFNGLTPIMGEKLENSDLTKYLVGLFKTHMGARFALDEVRGIGFRDAFIVAYKNCSRIPYYKAKEESTTGDEQIVAEYTFTGQVEVQMLKGMGDKNALAANANTRNIEDATAPDNTATEETAINTAIIEEATAPVGMVKAPDIKSVKGLLYTVQIGVYKNEVTKAQLRNLDPIYMEETQYGLTRYFTGVYTDLASARKQRDLAKQRGINDAFIIAYRDGKRMNVDEATRIAETQGNNVFADNTSTGNTAAANSTELSGANSGNTMYRVQIGAYKEQVPTDVVSKFLAIASVQGLDQIKSDNGMTFYTVGNYNSYDQATQMKNGLVSQGMTDAFVVAFSGNKKISVEDAKKILGQ